MEYIKEVINKEETIYSYEYERASNSYLMCIVAVIAGLPLPIINVIASAGYYLAQRKSTYFIRWHCIQAILAQMIMIPFNAVAFGWTFSIILQKEETSVAYFIYLFTIILFNIIEFFTVLITAAQVRKGENVRWFLIARITDMLCSKKNRDPYRI